MKKLIYAAIALLTVCMVFADDHIIQFVLNNGEHVYFKTSQIKTIGYDYHDQDSIDQAYRDSLYREFVKDSLYKDSLYKDSLHREEVGRTQTLGIMLDSAGAYSIFVQALKLTGLFDTLNVVDVKESILPRNFDSSDFNGNLLYTPLRSRNGFTVFAESDSVMKLNGINTISDLVTFANKQYGNATSWYDYLNEKGLTVSTGTDYQSELNALNMFMRYHILKSKMAYTELVYTKTAKTINTWNFCNGGEPYDYYETMLPHTLMKIWQPIYTANTGTQLFINRYITRNTLTNQLPHEIIHNGTEDESLENRLGYGTDDFHQVVSEGVKITREDGYGFNGWYHPIGSILVYNQDVPKGVLHERMRMDFTTMLPEMMNNGLRNLTMNEIQALSPSGYASRVAFAHDYFSNVKVYNANTRLRYNVRGAYNAWQSDCIIGWGYYDLAVKLPPLPTGNYEVRIAYSPMSSGGNVEYSVGNNPDDLNSFKEICTFDITIPKEDPRIGWTDYLDCDYISDSTLVTEGGESWYDYYSFYGFKERDLGLASDKKMRDNGYMRGPFGFKDHPENQTDMNGFWSVYFNMRRGTRNALLRKILGNITVKQSEDNWLRVRSLTTNNADSRFQLDFIEFVPVDVLSTGSTNVIEDWY